MTDGAPPAGFVPIAAVDGGDRPAPPPDRETLREPPEDAAPDPDPPPDPAADVPGADEVVERAARVLAARMRARDRADPAAGFRPDGPSPEAVVSECVAFGEDRRLWGRLMRRVLRRADAIAAGGDG